MCPLVAELANQRAALRVPVRVSCRVLGFSPQAYYKWRAKPVSDRESTDAVLLEAIIDIHQDDPEFGYRLICDELKDQGFRVGENRVARICSKAGVFSVHSHKAGSGKKPGPAVHDDLVERDFTAGGPNQLWLTDITEHPTSEGKLYLCAIKDVFSNKIVGYSMSDRMFASLAVDALRSAVSRRGRAGVTSCVVHSDRGSQFRSRKFTRELVIFKMAGSMGRVGAAGDNAAMESFFSLLQKNVLNRYRWTTRAQLRLAIAIWIETTYNRRRRQRRLGRLTPIEYETIYTTTAQAA